MKPIRRFLAWLLAPTSPDALVRLLSAWRLWVAGAVLGALLAWGAYALFPPPYRAQASVLVDNNLEEAWQFFPDRTLFYFLERETRKLEEVAWTDATLQTVAEDVGGVTVPELRSGVLALGQPAEGAWHFWAQDDDAQRAEALAAAWTQAFVEQVYAAVSSTPELEAARAALQAELLASEEPDEEVMEALTAQVAEAAERSLGISPYVQVNVTQAEDLPVERAVSLAAYLLVGSAFGVLVLALVALFTLKSGDGEETVG